MVPKLLLGSWELYTYLQEKAGRNSTTAIMLPPRTMVVLTYLGIALAIRQVQSFPLLRKPPRIDHKPVPG